MSQQITVLGASKGVGQRTVEQALQKGWKVVALSRHLDLPQVPNLVQIQGSATNPTDLQKAIEGSNAVIVAIGTNTSTKPTTLYSEAANALVQTFKPHKLQVPLLVVTGFGAGNSKAYQGLIAKLIFNLFLKAVYADKTRMEKIIAGQLDNWIIVRPARLTDDASTGHYQVITDYRDDMHISKISRGNVAHFLLEQAQNPTMLRQFPALSD